MRVTQRMSARIRLQVCVMSVVLVGDTSLAVTVKGLRVSEAWAAMTLSTAVPVTLTV